MAKILLVEDDKSLREIYGVRLQAEGYTIISAGDGEEALAIAIKERPDLIVSDVMMPKISGFDMLDILRSTTETKNIKVIMMTALSSDDQRARGEQLGADRYLVKSQVGIEDVVRTVHEVLGDAPVAPVQNSFAPPAPSAVPRAMPQAPTAPVAPSVTAPAPAPASPAPATPAAEPSVPSYAPGPQAISTPAAPSAQPSTPAPGPQPVQPQATQPTPAFALSLHPRTMPPTPPSPAFAPSPPAAPAPASPAPATPAAEPFSLPQPTAPFSTQHPAGLADRIIEPLTHTESTVEPIADLMSKELNGGTASSETSQPASPPAASGLDFEETPRPAGPQAQPPGVPPASV